MLSTPFLQQQIAEEIKRISLPNSPEKLYDPIRYILQLGGKHIRPLITLMVADLFGNDDHDYQRAIPAALAIEIFHNSTLVHDDIMDQAPLRRGKQTVHEKWDTNTAILSGDGMLVLAFQYLAQSEDNKLKKLLETFSETILQVCEGQQWDMDFEALPSVSIDQYIQMIKLKTSVLLGGAARLGAITQSAADVDVEAIGDFATHVGVAFQLQDDILDVFGDPEKFGKQIGGDILSNKKTYLLIKALELAKGPTEEELKKWLKEEKHQPQEKIKAIKSIYEKLGVLEHAQSEKEKYSNSAFMSLERISIHNERKQNLKTLAENLLIRES